MGALPKRGAVATLGLDFIREMEPEDLDDLSGPNNMAPVPTLQKITAAHHRQAQLIARGTLADIEVARLCGVTPQRIYQLKRDPSFQNLVAYYQSQISSAAIEVSDRIHEKLLMAGEAALDEINVRLDEEIKEIPVGELRKIFEMAGDRTVAPPRSTQQGSPFPPAKIELNFGWNKPTNPAKIIDGETTNE